MDIKKLVLESVVRHYIQEISEDPRRGIRKLVDLGQQNTKGGFRDNFLRFSHNLLRDEESPYYILVHNAVEKIDSNTLECVCINLGYNSWTKGAGLLRRTQQEKGITLPWNVTFHLDDGVEQRGLRWCRTFMEAGQRQGICSYSFLTAPGFQAWEELCGILWAFPDCGIFLFLPDGAVEWDAESLARLHNTVLLVDSTAQDWEKDLNDLCGNGCMCGLYRTYGSEEDAEEITSGRWLDQAAGYPTACAMAVAMPEASESLCAQVRDYIVQARGNPQAPTIPVDYYSDFTAISNVIVGTSAFLGIQADGTVTTSDGRRELSADKQVDWSQPEALLLRGV